MIWIQFLATALVIVAAGVRLARHGDVLGEESGLGRSWIGVVLLAATTSLPELFTGFGATALAHLPDIAVGDVLGGCMFNLLIFSFMDAVQPEPLSTRAHQGHILSIGFGLVLIGIPGLGLIGSSRLPAIGWIGYRSRELDGVSRGSRSRARTRVVARRIGALLDGSGARMVEMLTKSTIIADSTTRDISERSAIFPTPRVLVVDDEQLLRWAICETLAEHGYHSSEATDAESTRHLFAPGHDLPDVVLLDLKLPDSEDLGLAAFVQAHAPSVPIVLMTAFATREVLAGAVALGIMVMLKPFDMNALMSVVDRALLPPAA